MTQLFLVAGCLLVSSYPVVALILFALAIGGL